MTRGPSHLLVAVGDVADLVPGEGALWRQLVLGLVDVETQSVHPQQQVRALLVLRREEETGDMGGGGWLDSAAAEPSDVQAKQEGFLHRSSALDGFISGEPNAKKA